MINLRIFTVLFSLFFLLIFFVLILLIFIIAALDTQSNGFFTQKRVGQYGKPFTIYKIKTVHPVTRNISTFGKFLRKSKLDELPQLWNVFIGDMSFVGPRPDIIGYADKLQGENRCILLLKPGVTGLASLVYRNEEQLLASQSNPLQYNDEIIWTNKVLINKWYFKNRTFLLDFKILFYTVFPIKFDLEKFIQKHTKM